MESQRNRDVKRLSKSFQNKGIKQSNLIQGLEKFLSTKKIETEKALDMYTYGIPCIRLKDGKTDKIILSVDEEDPMIMKILSLKLKTKDKLKLQNLFDCDFEMGRGEIKELYLRDKTLLINIANEKNYITLLTNKKDTYDFIFEKTQDLDYFVKALLHSLCVYIYGENENLNEKFTDSIRNIWVKYDKNFSGKLDIEEFRLFSTELNLILKKTFSIQELFKSIDKDNSSTIEFEEFLSYFNNFTNGEEVKFIFQKYSKLDPQTNEHIMDISALKTFYSETQKEPIDEIDAQILILLIKKSIPESTLDKIKSKLENNILLDTEEKKLLNLKLDEFKILVYDKTISSVYKRELTEKIKNMDNPLTDYFLFSSHNTYLTGHQVYGTSDPEMYSSALLLGCRLVELDVYNGGAEGPLVKHGFTMTGEVLLKKVLDNIKKSAFIISEYPVVLSIENHCNEENQVKMALLFKEILIDLFVLDDDTDLVHFPTPNDLKRRFIIKGKRNPIYANLENIKKIEAEGVLEKKSFSTLQTDDKAHNHQTLNGEKRQSFAGILKNQSKIVNENPNQEFTDNQKHLETNKAFVLNKKISDLINIKNVFQEKIEKEIPQNQLKNRNSLSNLPEESKLSTLNPLNNFENRNNNIKVVTDPGEAERLNIEARKQKKKNVELISKLSLTIGMIGRKLYLDKICDMKYQQWDCVTKKDNYLIKKSADFMSRKKLVDYCKGSFLKAYPTKFDSSNYDCIKTWISGCQISAINIQKLECDFLLLNLIFYRQNKNCGLVLKPKKLRDRKTQYDELYNKPLKKLIITLVSGYMLNLLGFNVQNEKLKINLKKLKIEIKIVGSVQDDMQTKSKYEFSIEQNLFNPHFGNNQIKFDVYESELSAIFISISSDSEIIGRSVIPLCMLAEGLRCVPIFDINADEYNDSRLVCMIEYHDCN